MTKLNQHLAQADHADNDRHIGNRRTTVGADFTAERPPCSRYQQSRSIPLGC